MIELSRKTSLSTSRDDGFVYSLLSIATIHGHGEVRMWVMRGIRNLHWLPSVYAGRRWGEFTLC